MSKIPFNLVFGSPEKCSQKESSWGRLGAWEEPGENFILVYRPGDYFILFIGLCSVYFSFEKKLKLCNASTFGTNIS